MQIAQAIHQTTVSAVATMSAHPGKMYEYCRARRALAQADGNSYPEGVWSYEEYSSGRSHKSSPICFAVNTWLHSHLQGNAEANSVVIVSGQKLSNPGACSESFEISAPPGPNVLVQVSAQPKTRGAPGGKKPPSDIQELPEVRKKGPYTWDVEVQVTKCTLDNKLGAQLQACAWSTRA